MRLFGRISEALQVYAYSIKASRVRRELYQGGNNSLVKHTQIIRTMDGVAFTTRATINRLEWAWPWAPQTQSNIPLPSLCYHALVLLSTIDRNALSTLPAGLFEATPALDWL